MQTGGVLPVAALVMAMVVAMAASLPSNHRPRSARVGPNINEIEVENIASADDQVLMNLAGYLELHEVNSTRLMLDMNTVYVVSWDDDQLHNIKVNDNDRRVRLSISYEKGELNSVYKFNNMELSVNRGNLPRGEFSVICQFDEPFAFSLPARSRYSCQKVLSHSCSKDGKLVASLVLKSFELELNGNPRNVARSVFSKPAWDKSCAHWKGKEESLIDIEFFERIGTKYW